MGLFSIFKTKTEAPANTSKVSLIKEREEKVGISLAKKTSEQIRAQVNFMIDVSGSMDNMFSSGKVQQIIERIFPVALKLDLDGELNVWMFSNYSNQIGTPVTIDNFDGYVDRYISHNVGGGTSYSPVMKDVVNFYEKVSDISVLDIMVTDGDNGDHFEAESFIKEVSDKNHFWSFCGIGNESFNFLKKLDTMEGRVIDNASFFSVRDIGKMSDDDLYDELLKEFPSWIKEARSKNIIR